MKVETRRELGESESKDKEREKSIKILNTYATIIVYICIVTVTIVHECIILQPLMWVFF